MPASAELKLSRSPKHLTGRQKNSLPSVSSTETRDDKEGNHEWLFSPSLQSFRFDYSGVDDAAPPEILLVDDKLASISSADTGGMATCNDREGSQEPRVSPILKSVRLTSDSDGDAGTPEILSGIGTLERAKEEKMEYSLGSVSSLETGSLVTRAHEELDRETRVTLEMLMAMECLLPEERNDRGEERGFELRDCVSGSVGRSAFVCRADRQSTMSIERSSGSTIFARPDALFPLSPRPRSASCPHSPSSVSTGRSRSKDGALVSVSRSLDTGRGEKMSNSPPRSPSPRSRWTVAGTSESQEWESRVTVETLMMLENLLSEE